MKQILGGLECRSRSQVGLKACVQLFSNSPPIHNFTFAAEGGLVEEEFAPTFHFRLKNPQILKNQHLTFTNPQKSTFHFHLKDQPFTLKILKNQPFTFASKIKIICTFINPQNLLDPINHKFHKFTYNQAICLFSNNINS